MHSPRSGLLQGAEAYLRSVAARKGTDPGHAAMLRAAIQGRLRGATTTALRCPGTISDVVVEGPRGEPQRESSAIRPSVCGRSHQVRVQRWLLPFEQE
ncbi:hypothetical protein BBN63_00705 [Streptomyces niveus]|uniref:Uncharacterized protein n=1 Tax=Streptomyces niveus TaxID=193462 RepID=A0A1U9QLS9_STRNV|nr:hypothetical protein BBN63_00705 [Streptomyces niveus]